MKGEALVPMSNIVEYAKEEVALYDELIDEINQKIRRLEKARTKLDTTRLMIKNALSSKKDILAANQNNGGNVLLFDSFEENFLRLSSQVF
jgi:hypothetical protein